MDGARQEQHERKRRKSNRKMLEANVGMSFDENASEQRKQKHMTFRWNIKGWGKQYIRFFQRNILIENESNSHTTYK